MRWQDAVRQSQTQTASRAADPDDVYVEWRADRWGRVEELDDGSRLGWIAPVDRDAHEDWEPSDPWDVVTRLSTVS